MERSKYLEQLRQRFDNYDPDNDFNGAIGRDLADLAMAAFNNDPVKITKWYSHKIDELANKKTREDK